MSTLNTQDAAAALRAAGFTNVTIEPSSVSGSPFDYVYVYLTVDGPEGDHIIISDAAEYGDEGILVGKYPHFEEPAYEEVATVTSVADAIKWCVEHQ